METATVIPKDKLKSCQVWQWNTLDQTEPGQNEPAQNEPAQNESGQNAPDSAPAGQEHATPAEEQQADDQPGEHYAHTDQENRVHERADKEHRITEVEIATITQQAREDGRKQGHDEGLNKGYQEGYSKGYEEGRRQGESEIKTELAHVNQVFENLDEQLHALDQQVAQNLLTLAIDLAKKMTAQTLAVRPELIIPVVQDAVRQLPGMMQPLHLFLHPDNARIVRQHLDEQLSQDHWEIHEDAQLTPGGCRIEAGGSEVDASMETRWRRVLAAIGQKNEWIEK